MRIPSRLLDHPIETAIASILLLSLLVGSVDFKPGSQTAERIPDAVAQKL